MVGVAVGCTVVLILEAARGWLVLGDGSLVVVEVGEANWAVQCRWFLLVHSEGMRQNTKVAADGPTGEVDRLKRVFLTGKSELRIKTACA
ncbi:hypothetical protein HYQ46_009653 [Verticillium longisporum]|nr:hypothetical protein HYQ46_009653 [Verticillium longisporum]